MFEARIWLYVEPIMPMASRLNIIGDMSPDMVICKREDFGTSLAMEYFFRRDDIKNMDDLLKIGRNLRINLVEKTFEAFEEAPVVTKKGAIRTPNTRNNMSEFSAINKVVQGEVNKKFFTQ